MFSVPASSKFSPSISIQNSSLAIGRLTEGIYITNK